MTMNDQQLDKIRTRDGFIAALDQSGGSTPKALRLYGIDESAYSGDDEMFSIVHEMRTRIVTSPSFGGDRILGAILFENTMDREIEGKPTARYLWEEKNVVSFLKVDKGLAGRGGRSPDDEADAGARPAAGPGEGERGLRGRRCARPSSSRIRPACKRWSTSSSR